MVKLLLPYELLNKVAYTIGRPYGMTPEQVLTHVAMGDIPHPNAPVTDCGATDPRNDAKWCVRPPNRPKGFHNCYVRDMV